MGAVFARSIRHGMHMRWRRMHSDVFRAHAVDDISEQWSVRDRSLHQRAVMHRTRMQRHRFSHQEAEPESEERGDDPLRE